MGNGMNKVVQGLYVGSLRDIKDAEQLEKNGITHILSVHDNAKAVRKDKKYLCIKASDNSQQNLLPHFRESIHFIHKARVNGGKVLVHCIAGVSRSVTLTTAYIMTVTGLGWRDALNSVRGARRGSNPNFGFQKQLQTFEDEHLVTKEREKLFKTFREYAFRESDLSECKTHREAYQAWIRHGDELLSENTYPLPHNAYTDRKPKTTLKQSSPESSIATERAQRTSESETMESVPCETKREKHPSDSGNESETVKHSSGDLSNQSKSPSSQPEGNCLSIGSQEKTAQLVDEIFANEGSPPSGTVSGKQLPNKL